MADDFKDIVNDLDVANFKRALVIDTEEDNDLITQYLKTAKHYVAGAVGDDENIKSDQRFEFAYQMLAQFWYQNRAIDMQNTPYQVVSMIQQLRGEYD